MSSRIPKVPTIALVACTAVAIVAGFAATAVGNLTQDGCVRDVRDENKCRRPFVFVGKIDKGDPVNLVFAGGRVTTPNDDCMGDNAKGATCIANMIARAWGPPDKNKMAERFCDGGAHLQFRTQDGSRRVNPESTKSMTTSSTCKKEYHVRIWNDEPHGHSPSNHTFGVGAVHHEDRCSVPGACGHKIDMNWENVENEFVRQMARQYGNEFQYCVKSDYYPLAGSNPPGRSKRKYKTGYPSRISFQSKDEGCRGA